ncbi:DUF3073 domain-containing protein [Brachybacterium endophyticum]|uniref:DUF3073 domain-containing protein n=1 Tax=Brachybacterium endophyticum TaxID=2182385 RepID=A0A2U2RPD0_9MICO|nr:DUF3073 domain-containing protein [Brachybacterium endophyticum]PWH07719.1 DUF3073 domain-containing protein [Brachybacterium endophyticum]
MGRGRQKAKQTKVARDLKYYSPPTDLSALQRELQSHQSADTEHDGPEDDEATDWAEDGSTSTAANRH